MNAMLWRLVLTCYIHARLVGSEGKDIRQHTAFMSIQHAQLDLLPQIEELQVLYSKMHAREININ